MRTTKNPFLLFLPFLILYVILIILFAKSGFHGDEIRYFKYAENLTHGFYSPPYPHIDLGNGPGYPILITPLVAIHAPLIVIILLNAVFFYLSIVFLFKALQQIVSYKFSIIFSLIWAFYPNVYEQLAHTSPEVLAPSLIPLFIFALLKGFKSEDIKNTRKYLLIASFTLGYLILTKPIFGYVLIFLTVPIAILLIFNIKSANYKKSLLILLIAFIVNLPYLLYTYHLTGKMFYWSSFGGNNLYWMSSPFEGEYGDWIGFPVSPNTYTIPGVDSLITSRHQKDFDAMLKNKEVQKANVRNGQVTYNLTEGVTQDDLFRKIAIENIRSHPLKFLQNCVSNIGRILFNYPANYTLQKPSTLNRLPINGILLVLVLFSLIPTLMNWRNIDFPIRFLLFFALLYFGGSVLGSAGPRMFSLIVPILLIWVAFIISKSIKVKLKFNE